MKTSRTFGVEIEMNGSFGRIYGKPDWVEGGNRNNRKKIHLQPGWKCVEDGSCGSEFVSPPLCDTLPIERQIGDILLSGFDVKFEKAGLHVHVGAHDLTRHNCLELAQFCRHYERAIYSFVHPKRMKDEYCRPFWMSNADMNSSYNPETKLTNGNRYRGCNITSYDKHGTIEYRYSESTIDYAKIKALVDLFVKITDYVANNKGNLRCKSPRKLKEKRIFLLDLVGVLPESRKKLIETTYKT